MPSKKVAAKRVGAPKDASGAAAVVAAGGKRLFLRSFKAPVPNGKWYPTEDASKPAKRNVKAVIQTAKLRSSIKPGTVLILLAGQFQGKRVVFLKQLASGLLLVTGPRALNGVPLKRVSQAYVIATSTHVDVSGAHEAIKTVHDDIFSAKKERAEKNKGISEESDFFGAAKKVKGETSEARKALQLKVDACFSKLDATVQKYLKSKFSLSKNQRPHAMKF